MLWWALALLGLTVLVLYAMVSRRHFTFLLAGLGLVSAGGLGIAGVFGGETVNPIEAISRGFQDPAVTQPALPANPSPTPDAGSSSPTPDAGSSSTPPPAPNALGAGEPGSIGSGITGTEPVPAPPTTEPPPMPAPDTPEPPASTLPVAPDQPSPANTCPCTLEVSTNVNVATIKLRRDTFETLGSSGTPATFDNLPAGTYTITVEATGTSGYTGTVTLPQTRALSVYLEQ
jgi:hypothetical protein